MIVLQFPDQIECFVHSGFDLLIALFASKNFEQQEVALLFSVCCSLGVFGVQGRRKGQRAIRLTYKLDYCVQWNQTI